MTSALSVGGLTRRIIPCLDVTDGRVVKGVNFVGLRDAGDPVALAAFYDRAGADELIFLDITASSDSRRTVIGLVEQTAAQVFIPLTVGGGIRTVEDIRLLLAAGADKVSLNTAAVQDPALISRGAEAFGRQCIVVAIDARRDPAQPSGWGVTTHGGRSSADLDALAWAAAAEQHGAGEILLTSMDRDGTHDGFDLALTQAIAAAVGIPVIASGGAGNPAHFAAVLAPGGADAALAASIFHFGEYSVGDVKSYLFAQGVAVRL